MVGKNIKLAVLNRYGVYVQKLIDMKRFFVAVALMILPLSLYGQVDTTGWFADRRDSLETAVVTADVAGSYIPKGKDIKAEVITSAGLSKMACCNLAESFENSASVSVGYSDAVTGARQIRLLGQSGIYTQMLDENRPVLRGLSAPFGLSYVPGQWLESIQISKGVSSVINGVESMTGQINLEHRKPTDEKPLFLHGSVMQDGKFDLNATSSLQFGDKWSTIILAHVDANRNPMDMNSDGFMDDPRSLQFAFSNRWLYFDPDGVQVRFGVRAIQDRREGGQDEKFTSAEYLWQTDILNRSLDAYLKVGYPLGDDAANSVALVADYSIQDMNSAFGLRSYDALQHSGFVNLLYQRELSPEHKYTIGLSDIFDYYDELMPGAAGSAVTILNNAGLFGEYTFHKGDVFSSIIGLRAEYYLNEGVRVSPRLTLKYAPVESLVFRANAGRGIRYSTPLIDNIGVLSTSKQLLGSITEHPLEESWTFGGSATWYLPFSEGSKTYLSFDYFRTQFTSQMVADYDRTPGAIEFYLTPLSYTDNYQVDFSAEPFTRFTVTLTGRFTNARVQYADRGVQEKPMTSRYKGVLNLQYATNLRKWIFDFTASVNGPCRVWDFMKADYPSGYSSVYPLLYAQVTRRFRGFDIYLGGENLTNYKQKNPIIGADDPFGSGFDASCVWGPLMGTRIYVGIRVTIWKTE